MCSSGIRLSRMTSYWTVSSKRGNRAERGCGRRGWSGEEPGRTGRVIDGNGPLLDAEAVGRRPTLIVGSGHTVARVVSDTDNEAECLVPGASPGPVGPTVSGTPAAGAVPTVPSTA